MLTGKMAHSMLRGFLVILAFCVFLGNANTQQYDGCQIRYGRRGCYDKIHSGVLVTCDGQHVETTIPKTIPTDTVYLSMKNFRFGKITRANFTKMKTVECMNIMDSGITGADYDTFADMESLHEVELRNTLMRSQHVHFINHPMFRPKLVSIADSPTLRKMDFNGTMHLQRFKALNIDGNILEYLSTSIIKQLRGLESFSLSNNNFHDLDWDALRELEKLNKLYMDGNKFQNIPVKMIGVFSAVKELTLANNPFHCNCRLRWLKEFYDMTSDKALDYSDMKCASPFVEKMQDTDIDRFTCSKPSPPKISFQKLNSNWDYMLNCSSIGDPAPKLSLILPDGRSIVTPPSTNLSILETVTPNIIIRPEGTVHCKASNSEGEAETIEMIRLPADAWKSGGASVFAKWYHGMCVMLICSFILNDFML